MLVNCSAIEMISSFSIVPLVLCCQSASAWLADSYREEQEPSEYTNIKVRNRAI